VLIAAVSNDKTVESIQERLRKTILALDIAYMEAHLSIENVTNPLAKQRLLQQSESISALIGAARTLIRAM